MSRDRREHVGSLQPFAGADKIGNQTVLHFDFGFLQVLSWQHVLPTSDIDAPF